MEAVKGVELLGFHEKEVVELVVTVVVPIPLIVFALLGIQIKLFILRDVVGLLCVHVGLNKSDNSEQYASLSLVTIVAATRELEY